MTPHQCRLARELLDWSHADLGTRSGADARVVIGFENGHGAPSTQLLSSLRQTFEAAGIEFVDWGLGARLS